MGDNIRQIKKKDYGLGTAIGFVLWGLFALACPFYFRALDMLPPT